MNPYRRLFISIVALPIILGASSLLRGAEVDDRFAAMRQEEIEAKQARSEDLSNRIVVLQKQLDEDRKNTAKSQEKIWQDYTQSLEIERKKLNDQMITLGERQKMFEDELQKKRAQDELILKDKENEAKKMTLEAERLRAEIEHDRKDFSEHLKELKNRPAPPAPSLAQAAALNPEALANHDIKVTTTPVGPGGGLAPLGAQASRQEYYVEIGDSLDIDVWRVPDLSRSVPVRPDGRISMPIVGDLDVVGLSLVEVRELLTKKFSEYVWNPQVSISIRQFGGRKFIILGEISGPGVFRFEHDITLLEAIALAGGFKDRSRSGKVMIIRGDIRKQPQVKIITANMENVLKRGIISENIAVQPNDIIYVGKDIIGDYRDIIDNVVTPFFSTAIDYYVWHSAARADHNS